MYWVERDAAVVWHGFTQMACYADNAPVIIEQDEGREPVDVSRLQKKQGQTLADLPLAQRRRLRKRGKRWRRVLRSFD